MIIINGDDSPQFNREEVRFGPGSGEYSMRVEGPVEKIRALIPQLIASGASGVFVSDKSPLATIEFSYGSIDPAIGFGAENEQPSQIWEYFANEVEKDIMEADITAVNAVNGTASEKLLRKYIQGTDLTDSEVSSLSASAALLYADIKAGVRSIRVAVPTLKVSKFVSYTYQVKASIAGAGSVITTATLQSSESIPDSILFNLPAYTTSKPNRAYGWYKKFPNVQTVGKNGFTVSQEWEYGLWSTTLYGSPT